MRALRTIATLILVALAFVACGDARLTSNGFDPAFDGGDPSRPRSDAGNFDTDYVDDTYTPPPEDLRCVLIPAVGGDVFVGVDSTILVGAYLYSLETGAPMAGEDVRFGIVSGSVEGRLSSETATTNEDGLAQVRLTAGAEVGAMTLRVFSPCANSLDIEVDVVDLPTGNLLVSFNYPFRDVYDVSPIRVDLFPADVLRCRDIVRGELPTDAEQILETGSVAGSVTFNALNVDVEYTVLATGFGRVGERAAQGCSDGVYVRERRTSEKVIDLYLLPLDPVGTYDVLSHWDFREALAESGSVGATIVEILDIFEDPGAGIVDFLLGLVEDYVGGIISGVVGFFLDITGIDDLIADAINGVIESSPFLSDIVQIGRDLRAIVAELEVISTLEIGKLGSDYEVFGVENWTGVALYWRLGCDDTSPPDCGRIPIDGLSCGDLGLLRGEWTGRVVGYNRLDIDRHPVDLEYGRLILCVLENVLLPELLGRPGPVTLADLMSAIINCDGIGDWVGGGDGGCRCALGACICDDDIEGFCETFIDFTFGGIFRTFVDALSFDAVLDIRGSVTLVNNNEDIMVDGLKPGEYVGSINLGSSPVPFTADFCGVRQAGPVSVVDFCLAE